MKVKAWRVTGTKLVNRLGQWEEEIINKVVINPKKIDGDGVIVGELMYEPVSAKFAVTDEMLENATITPYVPRKRQKKEGNTDDE